MAASKSDELQDQGSLVACVVTGHNRPVLFRAAETPRHLSRYCHYPNTCASTNAQWPTCLNYDLASLSCSERTTIVMFFQATSSHCMSVFEVRDVTSPSLRVIAGATPANSG